MSLTVTLRHDWPGLPLDVDFAAPGGITAVFGPSGAGKTTILNAIAGLLRPRFGRITLDGTTLTNTARGTHLPAHRRRIGYVFQDGRLFPHLTVAGNIDYAQRFAGRRARGGPDRAAIVDLLGLGPLLTRRPATLSGGERSRVAMARAVLSTPRLLLLDEPFSALDTARRAEVLPYLERLRDATGLPMVLVSHDRAEVARLATRVVMVAGGRVVRSGPPTILPAQADGSASGAVSGPVSVLDGIVGPAGGVTVGDACFDLPGVTLPPGSAVRLHLPAADIVVLPAAPDRAAPVGALSGCVVDATRGEGGTLLQLAVGPGTLLAAWPGDEGAAPPPTPGTQCWAIPSPRALAGALRTPEDGAG